LLTLFSCTRGVGWARGGREAPVGPSWTVNPGLPLMIAVMVSLIISPFLATYWPEGEVDGLPSEGSRSWAVDAPVDLVLLHSLVVHPGCLKVLNLWCLHYHNIFPNTREPVRTYGAYTTTTSSPTPGNQSVTTRTHTHTHTPQDLSS
jgi:hypothetical protein